MLAIKRRGLLGGMSNVMPAPDEPLGPGDRLIVVGEEQDLEKLLETLNPRAFPAPEEA